ncbi:MAG: hypothetical protein IJS14_12565 [Lentisphaeria bacterium]|nr:hypothetical protein [Lentisphaeria bacterium]
MKNWIRLTVPALLVLLAACQADYTQEAMLRAREFALEHTRLLPETARNHIRYTTPELQFVPLFEHQPLLLTEYAHIARNVDFNPRRNPQMATVVSQFVWTPPELGYSVIAIGHSQQRMKYWEPLKVMLKNIAPYRKFYDLAWKAATSYVTNKMLYLTDLERLRVRTTEAEVRETSFDLEYMFEEQLQGSGREWSEFLKTLRAGINRRQYSLVWVADDPNRRIVVTGLGSVADLQTWRPACGMVIPAAQLDEYTLKICRKGPGKNASTEKSGKEPDKTAPQEKPGKEPDKNAPQEKSKP